MKPETKVEIEAARKRLDELNARAHEETKAELQAQPLLERLIFAAHSRCPCGAGLAYDPASEDPAGTFKGPSYWDCSAIILGTAVPSGQPGAVQHTDKLPFVFYEIKSENQPSAAGETTRPQSKET